MTLRYGSVCSGIEAATAAWHELGFVPAWFSEIASFPSRVLAHHYPDVHNVGSLVGLADRLAGDDRKVDLLVGGTPCQSFSVAGLRGGLADERGNLALEFARLAEALRPRWLLWENVPGVLSSDGGRAFASLLRGLSVIGYGLAWRVLDAQFYRVAQRRERVFLVGHFGAAAAAGAVLFEPEGVRRNPPTRGEEGQDVAGTLGGGSGGRGRGSDTGRMTFVPEVAKCLTTSSQRIDTETETFIAARAQSAVSVEENQRGEVRLSDTAPALSKGGGKPGQGYAAIAFNARQDPVHGLTTGALDTDGSTQAVCVTGEVTHALRSVGADASEDGTGRGTPITANGWRVRRLTPRECERLQGFPDDYTAIPGAKDGPRYAALGNSMAAPVMRWIGARIARVDALLRGAA